MKIAILGNGRMGKRISELAIERGLQLSVIHHQKNQPLP